MPEMITAYIGLGANLGDARQTLQLAVHDLAQLPDSQISGCSRLYRSAPIDASGPDYLNAVVRMTTQLSAQALLTACQQIESAHGRIRPYQNAPRTLDLDILLYGDNCINIPELIVPHPRMAQRAFVLRPLADLAPGLLIPGIASIDTLLAQVGDQDIAPLNEPRLID